MDIKKLREEQNPRMSQMTLARECGVSVQSVQKWENGCSKPRRENLNRLLEVLGVKK